MQNELYALNEDMQEETASCKKYRFQNSKVKKALATVILSVFTVTCVLPTAIFAENEEQIADLQERMEQIEQEQLA
ncbi:MAG: hypothetical protein IIV69_02320, partial [Peptococcaceae bacterium]|nr:hypothetical protein [Peptococcaceae bacterium]